MALGRLVLAAVLLVLTTHARPTHASSRDVVLLGGGPAFRDAVTVALGPWSIRVIAVDASPPPADVTRAAKEARALAERHAAAGVIWVAGRDREHALLVYDVDTDQVVSRTFTQAPPFDAPTAAAAALSVKTLLRASTVAPLEERIGAPSGAVPPPPSAPAEAPVPPPLRAPAMTIELGGAVRAVATDADTRLSLGGAYWFGRLGLGLTGRAGPGLGVEAQRFRGRFDELALGPSLRARLPLSSWIRVEPRIGITLHATRIDGVGLPSAAPATRSRLDLSAGGGAVLDFLVSRATALGIDVEGAYMLRYQRYFVGSTSVLTLAPVQGSVGLRLSVAVP